MNLGDYAEMSKYYNDSPIEKPEDDLYGVTPFAKSIASSITKIKNPIGTAIALNGPWGSGKSSVVNIIRASLHEEDQNDLVVTDFKCWWYRGEEALALAFLQNLHTTLKNGLGDKIKDLIPKLSKNLLQAGSVVGQTVAVASGNGWLKNGILGGASYIEKTFFSEKETVEKSFRKLADILEKQDKRFLVIIDDIDRLTPEEALAIFRLIKSVGRLPNVMYLLVFDRELAEKAVNQRYPSEGPHFLEKIIQAGFEVPAPIQTDLNDAILASISETCGNTSEDELRRFMNIFYDVVVPYMSTPRHVVRFQSAINVTWPAIAGEVSLADFVALETIRLYEPALFKAIRKHKALVCGTSNGERKEDKHALFLTDIPEERHELAINMLKRVFPKMESSGFGNDWIPNWKEGQRVCLNTYFDTYFRLSLSDEALSSKQIEELIERSNERDFIQITMLNAAESIRKSGKSMVPVYLDELNTRASKVAKENVRPLMASLFEIFDQIDLETDTDGGISSANTGLRYHWLIRRLTEGRFTIEERSELYLASIQDAQLGWAVGFTSSAMAHYEEEENRTRREDDCLVEESSLPDFIKIALSEIRISAENGSLLKHKELISILYRWGEFLGNDYTEALAWTNSLLDDDESLLVLAEKLTVRSWSMGMGGFGTLGDRISISSMRVQIDKDCEILDVDKFRYRLEQIAGNPNSHEDRVAFIKKFLEVWSNQRSRRG
ncbi:KAP family P-loop NTPase fold protein [Vibrio splendidus]|uniref:KAP family P-loop NTPase fold protein n=1 Tax=Vibrio splendidus TaxID=29497 RepID=UPI002158CB58|nr:P-loop NTPase fold protein [Vibrio splendidus]